MMMVRFIAYAFAAAFVATTASLASAADMTKAPAKEAWAADSSHWAGAYVGASIGYGWDEIKASALGGKKADPHQFMPGGVAGYRWGRVVTFGLELNGLYAGHSDTIVPGLTGKTQYLGDVTAQVGLAINPSLLVYVGAGPALANSQLAIGGVASTANNFGWVGRVGFDTKLFNDNWTVGLVYAHYALGDGTYFGVINTSHTMDVVQARLTYRFGSAH